MAWLTLVDAHLAHGHWPLLDAAGLAVERGERLGLIGRNGSGKSSLLRVLAGLDRLDRGTVQHPQGLRVVLVEQEPSFDADASVFEAVADGVADARRLRARFEHPSDDVDLDALHAELDAIDGWSWEQRVDEALARLRLDGTLRLGDLSGGVRKRVALARALVARPDLLLLDEPTNHLDLDAIAWLESLITGFAGAVVVVSHDRAFLDAVATRIVELDRGQIRSYPGRYADFERRRADELAAEALARQRADRLLAQEEVWVRQGVEARRTRSVARVARLERLRAQRATRREQLGQVRLELDRGTVGGRLVAELNDVSMRYGNDGPWLIDGLSATLLRGDKVGIVGPNGVGKTTLLRLILGELQPVAGRLRRGTGLQVAYFDQMRAALDPEATLVETISPGSDWVEIGGRRQHVMAYLGDFLFAPERARSPVRTLSGGERNRLLLARLFALPANLLVLDEPTNDLDLDTLELLEDTLQSYAGTVFLVSHDRRFLDAVVTSCIVWEGDRRPGRWREVEGGVSDWLRERAAEPVAREARPAEPVVRPAPATSPDRGSGPPATDTVRRPRKLSYKEQRELDALPGRIDALEAEQRELSALLADGRVYASDPARARQAAERSAQIEDELMQALERWESLGSAAG